MFKGLYIQELSILGLYTTNTSPKNNAQCWILSPFIRGGGVMGAKKFPVKLKNLNFAQQNDLNVFTSEKGGSRR